jgi:hypothetical protein
MVPDTATLSEQLRVCLQEGDENPRDFTTLFDLSIYQLDTTCLPKVIKLVLRLPGLHAALHSAWLENRSLGIGVRSHSCKGMTFSDLWKSVGKLV